MKSIISPKFGLIALFTLLSLGAWAQSYLINESFESATFPPTGWTNSSGGAIRATSNARTGSACMAFNGENDAIYTPKLTNPNQLSFWYRRSSNTTSWTLKVQVSADATNWTDIGSITTVSTTYQQFTYDLSSYSDIYVRLLDQRSSGAHERYVDDFTITQIVSCTPATASFAASTVNKITTDAAFTNTFTSNNTSSKSYTSSTPAVATVNASSGLVTIVGAGTTTISVTQVADATYCAVSANYTLNITNPPYTVSFNAGTGSYTGGSLTETSGGAGVTLPAATPCSDDWTFAGWATAAVVETTTAPTLLLASTTYYPTANITLYAVYSKTESGGSGTTTSTYGFEDGDTGWTVSGGTVSTANPKTGTKSLYINNNNTYVTYNNIVAAPTSFTFSLMRTSTNSNYNVQVQTSTDNENWTTRATYPMSDFANGSYTEKTTDLSSYSNIYVRLYVNNTTAVRHIDDISITYSGGLTTTYNSNPDCNPASISVSELELLDFSVDLGIGDQYDGEILEVEGFNLTEDMSFVISGTYADFFDYELDNVFDKKTGGIVYIYYTPTAAGNHSAMLTISSEGADDVEVALSGVANLPAAPVATAATNIVPDGFTANWEAVTGVSGYEVNVYKYSAGVNATDLFFSEYVEGSSNNKYIEIYNGTGSTVDLANYKIQLFSNGKSETPSFEITLSGNLSNGATLVYMHKDAALTLPAGVTPIENSTVMAYNGDDALVLYKISTSSFVDIIGCIGEQPTNPSAWTADVGYSTLDKTLVRKPHVFGGVTTNPSSGFPTLATEWDVYDVDVVTNLGSHTYTHSSSTEIEGSPFSASAESTSKVITGLNPNTEYHYTVKSVRGGYESVSSNEITLTTLPNTPVDWGNLQWPNIGSIDLETNYVVYGRVYKDGITNPSGQGAYIKAWVGYSTDNTDPSTWTNWVEAEYNKDEGNNDEYMADLGLAIPSVGTYYYAFRYQYHTSDYVYGGYSSSGGGIWDGTNYINGSLTISYDPTKAIGWGNVQHPASGSHTVNAEFLVYGQVYKNGITDNNESNASLKAWLGYSSDDSNPANWDESQWLPAEFNESGKGEYSNNHEYKCDLGTAISDVGKYYYVYRYQYDNGEFYYGGTDNKAWNATDKNFGEYIALPPTPVATAATDVTAASFQANWTEVSDATYNLKVQTYFATLNENFFNQGGSGGNDDLWSGNIASSNTTGLDTWSLVSTYGANKCIRIGTTTNQGSAKTPALDLDGDAILTFRAGAWDAASEKTTLLLEIEGGGSLSAASVTLTKGSFSNYTITITGGTANTKVTFKGEQANNSRFFLDEVKVVKKVDIASSPFTAISDIYKVISGLDEDTKYFYQAQSVVDGYTSYWSNIIEVTTSFGDPLIEVDDENLFFQTKPNQTFSHELEISTKYLTQNMQFAFTGSNANLFSYQTKTGYDAKTGGTIIIKYSPTAVGNHNAILTISNNNEAPNVVINLKASAIETMPLVFYTETFGVGAANTPLGSFTAWHNSSTTINNGGYANAPDVRTTQSSADKDYTLYPLQASGGNNIYFNTTDEGLERGFVVEGINASNYRNIQLQFGYYKYSRKNSYLDVYYHNGSTWTKLDYPFIEKSEANVGWHLSPLMQLPAEAQIANLKLKFVKPANFYNGEIRIDDIWMRAEHKMTDLPVTNAATDIHISDFAVSWENYTGATKYLLDISDSEDFSEGDEVTLAAWAYASETEANNHINTGDNSATPNIAILSNQNKKLTSTSTGSTASPTIYRIGGGTEANPYAISATGWQEGIYKKYFQVTVNTTGYNNITLSSWNTSSDTGPKHFIVQYKTKSDADWINIPEGEITVSSNNNYTNSSKLTDLPLPTACDNQEEVLIRWVVSSTVQTKLETDEDNNEYYVLCSNDGGTSRIANLYIKGKPEKPANDFSSKEFTGTSTVAENMNHTTTYYYRVRATDGKNLSNASIIKNVTTKNGVNEWMGTSNVQWTNAANWSESLIPTTEHEVVIKSGKENFPIIGQEVSAFIKKLTINEGAKIEIAAGGSLIVKETITNNNGTSGILIKADSDKATGTLLFNNPVNEPVQATVEMYARGSWEVIGGQIKNVKWQYFGIPFTRIDNIENTFYGAIIRKHNEAGTTSSSILPVETGKWVQLMNGSSLAPIQGYEIAQPSPKTYVLSGTLYKGDFNYTASYTPGVTQAGQHIISNPYMAAIPIDAINFGADNRMDETVYVYNTGSLADFNANESKTGVNPGQYIALPFNVAGYGSIPNEIAPMQGFLVRTAQGVTDAGSFSIAYNQLVKNTAKQRAPKSPKSWLRLTLSAENTGDVMWLFSEPETSRDFDNGWDGRKMGGDAGTPMLFSHNETGNYQINAMSDIDKTDIAFRAGSADTDYTITFNHGDGIMDKYVDVYFEDLETGAIINISEDDTEYSFQSTNTSIHSRFKIHATKVISYVDKEEIMSVYVYADGRNLVINNASKEPSRIDLYDTLGRLFASYQVEGGGMQTYQPNVPQGTYIVKVTNSKIRSTKVVLR